MTIVLDQTARRWIDLKWAKIRRSQMLADKANNEWTEINTAINRWMDESGIIDIVQRTKVKGASLPLKDALAVGTWHSAEASRHIADLQLFLKLKELGVDV